MHPASKLAPGEIQILLLLDNGFRAEDSVGRPLVDFEDQALDSLSWLVVRGLVEFRLGSVVRDGVAAWVRLTQQGKDVLGLIAVESI